MKKQEGFKDQILIVIPPEFYLDADIINRQFYFTDIGYFPNAEDHLVERTEGCPSNILIICNSGSGWFESGGRHHEIKNGQAVIISEKTPHKYGSNDNLSWSIFWIHFKGQLSTEVGLRISGVPANTPFALPMGVESRYLFNRIYDSLKGGISPSGYNLACSRMWNLTGSLNSDRLSGSNITSATVNECISFMKERIHSSLTLEELSTRVSMSPQYLCRLFKQKTGHSPIEHYTSLKIQHACTLLDMSSDRINEISLQVGIEDPYYFTRTFKKVMGLSPRDYRNRQK